MTTTIATHNPVNEDPADEHADLLLAVAKVNAIGRLGDTARVESNPHPKLTEEEIVRAAITVILVSLVTVIGIAAGAILTMG